MSSKKFKSQASSARAASTAFGASSFGGFGNPAPFQTAASPLSYVTELPDLSAISEPRAVVSYKNLSKKDSVTKAKALEELQDYLSQVAESGVENAVLEAWINIYPRTSIDNSRRVRQLAHSLQGAFTVATGKRIVPYLPKVIGAWLSGAYDSDKSVSRSAQDAFDKSFITQEKQKAVWRLYQRSLIEYTEDAILNHTPQTLSDERTTSPDDAEAKHVRVVGTAALVLGQLLVNITDGPNDESRSTTYAPLLTNRRLWQFAHHHDAFVRKGISSLVSLCATRLPSELEWTVISTCFLAESLHRSQLGSSRPFAEALLAVTVAHPAVWTEDYHGKTSAGKRLFQYLKQGSQRGPESVWPIWGQLIPRIPLEVWCSGSNPSVEDGNALLAALHEGVSNPDEPRSNASAAWLTYIRTCFWVADLIEVDKEILFDQRVTPMIYQYVEDSSERPLWRPPVPAVLRICSQCFYELWSRKQFSMTRQIWNSLADQLIEAMTLSLPETSREFKTSQESLIAKAKRLGPLQVETTKKIPESRELIAEANNRVVEAAASLLKSRNGEPYGAAGVIQELPLTSSIRLPGDFLQVELPSLLSSPSGDRLVTILLKHCRQSPAFEASLDATVNAFVHHANLRSTPAYGALLRGLTNADMTQYDELQETVLNDVRSLLKERASDWSFVRDVVDSSRSQSGEPFSEAPTGCKARVIEEMMGALSIEAEQEAALHGFEAILTKRQTAAGLPLNGSELLSKLLLLADSPNELVADRAADLSSRVKQLAGPQGSEIVAKSTTELIAQQLAGVGQFISILGLVELAQDFIRADLSASSEVFPTSKHWESALTPFLNIPPLPAAAIVGPLQSVVYGITKSSAPAPVVQRDSDDFSSALRLTLYVTRLLTSTDIFQRLNHDQVASLHLYYPQALHLINEKLSLEPANNLWGTSTPEVIEEMAETLSQGQATIAGWIKVQESVQRIDAEASTWVSVQGRASTSTSKEGHSEDKVYDRPSEAAPLASTWLEQLDSDSMTGLSAEAYRLGVSFTSIMSECLDAGGMVRYANRLNKYFQTIRHSEDLVRSTALIIVAKDFLATSPQGKKICNELVADATDLNVIQLAVPTLRPLVLLNTLLQGDELLLDSFPTPRLVFLAKSLVRLLKSDSIPHAVIGEILKLLQHVVGPISEIYGEHWEDIVGVLAHFWHAENDLNDDLPTLHASLRLYNRLNALVKEATNEDLVEAWGKASSSLVTGLLHVLKLFKAPVSGANQPRAITTDLLQRQLKEIKLPPAEMAELFPLIASDEQSVQDAAFHLLHRAVPEAQQEISLDVALEKQIVHLPGELLSLLLHAPSMQTVSSTPEAEGITWLAIRRHLLGWKLVLDHFTNASYQLQGYYADDIKESGSLPPLLDFICDLLRITSGKPLDASRFDIKAFEIGGGDSLEREAQWLAVHLYYLCLLHLPSLVKDWFIEQKNRIKSPLESWTQKHLSPLIVSASLKTVSDWAATQDTDDRPVTIKSSPKGSELVASVAIDDESPPISLVISLPGAYPLEQAVVSSRNRVGVSDKNWQNWLRTFQVIIFSTGSLVEGLVAFRRNVQGALKGQSECAICYSIIGTDMQTPNKRCGTCKNNFHSTCLFRWFKSSNSSSCPLCRNNFNYT